MKDNYMIYYVSHHGENFIKLNRQYKMGTTIAILKKVKDLYEYYKIISSPDDGGNISFLTKFFPTLKWCVLANGKKETIRQVFTKEWYDE